MRHVNSTQFKPSQVKLSQVHASKQRKCLRSAYEMYTYDFLSVELFGFFSSAKQWNSVSVQMTCCMHMTSNICWRSKISLNFFQTNTNALMILVLSKSLKSHLSHVRTFIVCFWFFFLWLHMSASTNAIIYFELGSWLQPFPREMLVKNKPLEF